MHEHVFVLSPEIIANYPEGWGDEAAREADAVDKLNALKAIGVDTIVDPTVIGLGRYIPRIARVAAQTRPADRRGHRRLHLQRRADVLPLHRPGTALDGPSRWSTCSSGTSPRGSRAPA